MRFVMPGVTLLLFQSYPSHCFQTMHREVLTQSNVCRTLVTSSLVALYIARSKNKSRVQKDVVN